MSTDLFDRITPASRKVTTWVFDNSKQKGAKRLLILAIAQWANEDGINNSLSVSNLAQLCCIDERRARRLLKELAESGELRIIPCSGATNHYELTQYRIDSGITPGGRP